MIEFLDGLDEPLITRGDRGDDVEPTKKGISAEDALLASSGQVYIETCSKCGGSGRYRSASRFGAACFACKGEGRLVRRTSPEARAKAKARLTASRYAKEEATDAKRLAWQEANPAVYAWMCGAADRGFNFAVSLRDALVRYGALTDGQLAAAAKLMAADALRQAARTAEAEAAKANAPVITVDKIEEAFTSAKASGLKRPKLRLGDFVFSPAPETGRNAGAIYVKARSSDTYLGKVVAGKFQRNTFSCTTDLEAEVLAVAADPKGSATAYGKLTGACSCCGRGLTDSVSVALGIGPICAEKFGW